MVYPCQQIKGSIASSNNFLSCFGPQTIILYYFDISVCDNDTDNELEYDSDINNEPEDEDEANGLIVTLEIMIMI